jgi:hypothetical protein
MTLKNKIYLVIFTIFEFVVFLLLLGYMAASPLETSEQKAHGTTLVEAGAKRGAFSLLSFNGVLESDRIDT